MTSWFADTFYFLAILNPADESHAAAASKTPPPTRPLVTTGFVLLEVADALSAPRRRSGFVRFIEHLRSQQNVEIIPPSASLFDQGLALFADRQDKAWSLTDCISFTVMRDRGIREALTGDHHFEQAGFVALLR